MSVTFSEQWLEENRGRVASDSGKPRLPGGQEPKKKRRQPERDMQAALFEMAAYKETEIPALKNLYANVNGQYRAGQQMEPGLKAGVPDVFLAAVRSGPRGRRYGGLYLELKAPGGRVRPEQRAWLQRLRDAGYAARVAFSLDEAWTIITDYIDSNLPTYES